MASPLPPPPPRPFGSAAEDLEFDFGSADRPTLVTALLAACAPATDPQAWWRRPVGERIAALLALERRTSGNDAIGLTLTCPGCNARFEIALAHDALPQGAQSPTVAVASDGGALLTLRRPTGEDLRAWHAQPPATREEMLTRLHVGGEPDPADAVRSAEALANADPLLDFEIACTCPECGCPSEREVDLEGIAMRQLAARQRGVLREVHALASHYGWTEREIFSVAAPRRARYLDLIVSGDGT